MIYILYNLAKSSKQWHIETIFKDKNKMTFACWKVKKGLREALTMSLKAIGSSIGTYLRYVVRVEWQTISRLHIFHELLHAAPLWRCNRISMSRCYNSMYEVYFFFGFIIFKCLLFFYGSILKNMLFYMCSSISFVNCFVWMLYFRIVPIPPSGQDLIIVRRNLCYFAIIYFEFINKKILIMYVW